MRALLAARAAPRVAFGGVVDDHSGSLHSTHVLTDSGEQLGNVHLFFALDPTLRSL